MSNNVTNMSNKLAKALGIPCCMTCGEPMFVIEGHQDGKYIYHATKPQNTEEWFYQTWSEWGEATDNSYHQAK